MIKGKDFKKLFPSSVPEEGLGLLKSLLEYEPLKRITAVDALAHPFFDELRNF